MPARSPRPGSGCRSRDGPPRWPSARSGSRRRLRGLAWIVVPVLLKVRFGVLEVISTLLLNFVAEALVSFAVTGPLQEAKRIYPQSDPIATSARLPTLPGSRLHSGSCSRSCSPVALVGVLPDRAGLPAQGGGPGAQRRGDQRADSGEAVAGRRALLRARWPDWAAEWRSAG